MITEVTASLNIQVETEDQPPVPYPAIFLGGKET